MRQKRDKVESRTLEHYASQLNKNLKDRIEELTRRVEEIHISSKEGLYTQNDGEYNETNRGDDTFETRRTSQKEGYRTLEYDEGPMEQPHQRAIGLSLDQMISQISTFDGNSRKLTAFCSNIRKILSIFWRECKTYLFMYLQNKITGRVQIAITS
jgi:hypothetical protein